MKKINKILITSVIGGVILIGITISDKQQINNLQQLIERKNSAIHEYFLKNEEISNENSELLRKNKQLTKDNKELREELKEFRLQVTFNSDDITSKSNLTSIKLRKIFESNNTYKNLIGLENAFIDAEKQYNVNAIFLLSLVSQESNYGGSRRAIEDNNLAGYEVYSNSSKGRLFSSKYECIMHTAKLLSNEYLNKNGLYYKGRDIYSVNNNYCVTEDKYSWSRNIISIANTYVKEVNSLYNIN